MKSFRIIFAAFFLATFVASNAFGSFISAAPGRIEPQRLRWKDNSISIAISSSLVELSTNIKAGSDVPGAIRKSIQAWQKVADVEILIQPSEEQSVSPSEVGDGVSLITIAQTPENVVLFSKYPQAESAKTRVFYNRKGFITEADIVLSPFLQFSTDGSFGTFDLEATLTHEIGHLLGLRHSGVLGSTMANSILMNGELGIAGLGTRLLANSDIASIRDLYGMPDESEICCAAVTGKLTNLSPRPFKNLRI
ncbi:MAG: matrixin family metalloprotease, partial [Pyrinomonadaceae bacterium]